MLKLDTTLTIIMYFVVKRNLFPRNYVGDKNYLEVNSF